MDVKKALQQVEALFPFKQYISEDVRCEAEYLVRRVAAFVPDFSKARLLDIGSGAMNLTSVFAALGMSCCAVDDLSDDWHRRESHLNKILSFADAMGIHFYHQKNDYSIPFERGTFDVVLINAVIEHLHESPRDLLNTAFEFLKPGGLLIVTIPNAVNLRKRLSVFLGKTNYPAVEGFYHSKGQWRGHVREYTLNETKYVVEQNGGQVVFADTYHLNLLSKLSSKLLRLIYKLITAVVPSLRDGVIVCAKKPEGWQPVSFNKKTSREALKESVPQGVH